MPIQLYADAWDIAACTPSVLGCCKWCKPAVLGKDARHSSLPGGVIYWPLYMRQPCCLMHYVLAFMHGAVPLLLDACDTPFHL
jgi:hypothetical protein